MTFKMMAVTAAALLALTACGGDDDAAEEAATSSPAATPAAAPTEAEQSEPPPQAKSNTQTKTYRVKGGDSLSVIAERFNTTVKELVELNGIDDKHHIREGQKLKVPSGG